MDNEKIERQIAFIIDQQAKFSVDIAKLEEGLDRIARNIDNNAQQIEHNSQNIDRNTRNIESNTQHILKLTDALVTLTNFAQKHEGEIAELRKQTKETDERLSALINVVENSIGRKN